MAAPFEDMSTLDRTVHEPARLAILTALTACETADFVFLQSLTGLTKGNLGNHLGKLERARLVTIEKRFRGKIPQTRVQLTQVGRNSIERHWEHLQELRKASMKWGSNIRAKLVAHPQGA